MIIGTAGHVDHGKTALVKALTGVDTDRLAEEKRRGITIDLGYAYTDEFGFVDVPGHERFVHTMLAGASGIDTGLLVVALTEGIRPQTREHLQILSLLGIETGVVALTKADLAAERVAAVSAELRRLLSETPLADAPMIAVSALTGAGIDDLRTALLAVAPPPRAPVGYPRLAIDRAFTLTGAGLVVTGTLVSGRITVEDRLVLSPVGLDLRVRGLRAQNRPASEAVAGQRVALNITGPRLSKDAIRRGDWVLHPALHAPTASLDAQVTLLPDAAPLRQDIEVHLHLGAAHVMARMSLLDRDRLAPGEAAMARLTLREPIGALARDRLVLRDTGATRTIGGGVALDPAPPRRGRRTSQRLAQLQTLTAPDPVEALRALLEVAPHWTDAAAFLRARNVPEAEHAALIEAVPARLAGGLLLAPAALDRIGDAVLESLAAHHRTSPELPGLQAERLRLSLPERPPASAFAGIVQALLQTRVIAQDGPWLRLPEHTVTLSAQDQRIWQAARPMLEAERFRPPRTRDIAAALHTPEPVVRATMKRLQRMGQLVEVAQDHFFLRETVAEMVAVAGEVEGKEGVVMAATFRDRLDNGRKVAIQILEFFDRTGVTIRSGDARRVRPDRRSLFGEPPA
ncbi:MAG: selenocysteine-specific translation elongation factor [Rhodopila sp.]